MGDIYIDDNRILEQAHIYIYSECIKIFEFDPKDDARIPPKASLSTLIDWKKSGNKELPVFTEISVYDKNKLEEIYSKISD